MKKISTILLSILLLLSIGTTRVFAGEMTKVAKIGNNEYETLQSAIDNVPTDNTETTIVMIANTEENVSISANKNILLDLNGKNIDAKNKSNGCVISVSFGAKLTIDDSTATGSLIPNSNDTIEYTAGSIQNGYNGIFNGGTLIIKNGIIQNFTSSSTCAGGAIQTPNPSSDPNTKTKTVINGGLFKNNNAQKGGVIAVTWGSLTINNGTFYNNTAQNGSVIFCGSSGGNTVTIENCYFYKNIGTNGGAIYAYGQELESNTATVVIKGGDFIENVNQNGNGGAIKGDVRAKIVIEGGNFIKNSAQNGCAVYATDRLIIKGGIFKNNFSTLASESYGGAIYSNCSSSTADSRYLIISGGEFLNNYTDYATSLYCRGNRNSDIKVKILITGGIYNGSVYIKKSNGIPFENGSEILYGKFGDKFEMYESEKIIKGGIYSKYVNEEYIWDDEITPVDYTCVANTDMATNTKYPYTIGVKNKVSSDYPADGKQDVNEEPAIDPSVNSNNKTALKNSIEATSIDLLPEALSLSNDNSVITPSVIQAAIDTKDKGDMKTVTGERVYAYLEQEIVDIEDNKDNANKIDSFTVDITPMYVIKAVGQDAASQEVTAVISEPKVLKVSRTILMKVYLPNEFVYGLSPIEGTRVYVKHKGNVYGLDSDTNNLGGIKIQKEGDVGSEKYFVEFYNPDGFSEFEFSLKELTPDPKPSKKSEPTYKDETCETVIGKDWTWDNNLGVCKLKGYRIVNTETK